VVEQKVVYHIRKKKISSYNERGKKKARGMPHMKGHLPEPPQVLVGQTKVREEGNRYNFRVLWIWSSGRDNLKNLRGGSISCLKKMHNYNEMREKRRGERKKSEDNPCNTLPPTIPYLSESRKKKERSERNYNDTGYRRSFIMEKARVVKGKKGGRG